MTTIFWKKDDPDEFQVREVNVPGVFPKPSSKINSSTVVTAPKPWLRPKRSALMSEPRLSRHKQSAEAQQPAAAAYSGDQNATLQVKAGSNSKPDHKVKISASLKDLSSEDKKRVANLIKELAKAGEERKLAVNTLHQERTYFQGKEEALKIEQEKLILERDELREKILEYQFLINQYSKQIHHENETELKLEKVLQEQHGTVSVDELVNTDGNLKPPLHSKETEDNIPTYYNVVTTNNSKGYQKTENATANIANEKSKKTVENYVTNSQISVMPKGHNTAEGKGMFSIHMANRPNSPSHCMHENALKLSEKEPFTQASTNGRVQHIPSEEQKEKNGSEVQKTLLEQQNKLLEQQNMIQQQLENLQMIQQRYAEEFSQIATYSADLRQAVTAEKASGGNAHKTVLDPEMRDNRASKAQSDSQHMKEPNSVEHQNNLDDAGRRTNGGANFQSLQSSKNPSFKQNHDFIECEQPNKNLISEKDSYLNKSIEQIPGYLLHTNSTLLQHKSDSEMPTKSLLSQSRGMKTYNSNGYDRISETLQDSVSHSMASYQWRPAVSMKQDSFTHSSHLLQSRFKSPQSNKSSIFSAKRPNSFSDSTPGNIVSFMTPTEKYKKNIYSTEKKQHSILSTLEDIESEFPAEEDEFLNPGSYTGFAKSILQGKFKNEQIFASTDYSDNDTEPEDNELLADVFFLKKY